MRNAGKAGTSINARGMRAHNSGHVLRLIKKLGPVSRADLTRHTRLSTPTVAALVNTLLEAGLLAEYGEGNSTGGRKPQLISFNALCGVVVGANIGASVVQLALCDMNGGWLDRRQMPFTDARPRPLVRQVAQAITAMLKEASCERKPLFAVAVGAPGMTDIERGVVLEAANLEGWINVPARDMLHEALRVPVIVDNDVNLAALGEHWRGGGRGLSNFVFVSLGTGIGAGIIIDHKIHRGHKWHAGEISHLNVDFREWSKDFGAAGYLEFHLGAIPQHRTVGKPGRDQSELDDGSVVRLGTAVANIATLIDPELIVIGGRVALAQPDIIKRAHEVAASIAPNCPEVRATELGEDAALYGSVRIALNLAHESLHETVFDTIHAA